MALLRWFLYPLLLLLPAALLALLPAFRFTPCNQLLLLWPRPDAPPK